MAAAVCLYTGVFERSGGKADAGIASTIGAPSLRYSKAPKSMCCAWQGCEDLEEVLSERLQQLPAPLESAPSAGSQQEPPRVVIPDDLPAERERVRLQPALTHVPAARVLSASLPG